VSASEKLAEEFLPKRVATLPEYVRYIADKYGDRPALVARQDGGKRTVIAYRDLASRVDSLAEKLRAYVSPGDFVALWAENAPGWAVAAFAVLKAGGILVPIVNRLGPAEVDFILGHSKPKILVCSDAMLPQLEKLTQALIPAGGALKIDGWPDATGVSVAVPAGDVHPAERPPLPDDLALVMYTSGSMSDPKGVMLSHRAVLENVRSMLAVSGWHLVRLVSILPLSHMFEFTAGLVTALSLGATVTYPRALASDEIISAMRDAKVTAMICVPRFLRLFLRGVERKLASMPPVQRALTEFCLRTPILRSAVCRRIIAGFGGELKYLIVGGGPTDVSVLERFAHYGMEVLQGYGLSEAAPVVTVNQPGANALGTTGTALPGIEVKVADPNEQGVGEVLVRGANVMAGYYNNLEATARALRDGWLYTGDFGKMDGRGNLTVFGRMGTTVVNEAGENIFPEEIEEVILRYRGAAGAAVFGYPPDRRREVIAIVQADEATVTELAKQHGNTEAAMREVRAGVDSELRALGAFKRPDKIHVIQEALPQTGTNKNRLKDIVVLYERIRTSEK